MYKAYFGQKDGDNSGMRTAIFGPAGWIFLHSIAQNYPWNPTQQQMEDYYNFFRLTGNVLPCRYCRESYQLFITQKGTRLTLQTMKNRKSVVIWLYRIHNKVNKKLGVKDHPTLKEVWDKYESFRSVCHKTKQKKAKGCTVPLNGIRKKNVINFVDEPILKNKNKNKVKNKNKNKVKLKTTLMYNHFGKKTKPPKPPKPSSAPPPQSADEAPPPENVFTNETLSNAMDMLSVTNKHDIKQIKKQYRMYSLMYHPDRPTGDEWMFKEVNNAYQLLMAYNQQALNSFGKRKSNFFGRIRIDLSPQGVLNAMNTLGINDPDDLATINERWNYLRNRYGPGSILYNIVTYSTLTRAHLILIMNFRNNHPRPFHKPPNPRRRLFFGFGVVDQNMLDIAKDTLSLRANQLQDIDAINQAFIEKIQMDNFSKDPITINRENYKARVAYKKLIDNLKRSNPENLHQINLKMKQTFDYIAHLQSNEQPFFPGLKPSFYFGKKAGKKTIKLISIKRSNKSGKKLMATFETNGRKKIIHFGQATARDFTLLSKGKDSKNAKTVRHRYIFRHYKDLGTGDPSRAGFLSMFVLWNKPSLQASIADYKRRLNVYNRTGKFPKNISGYVSPGKKSKYQ